MPLFSQVTLRHGPIAVLGRTILIAEQLCQQQGVLLSFATPAEFLSVNQANADTWLPLFRLFDHRFNNLTEANTFYILGHNLAGDIVACQAARFYDWQDTNCADEIECMRMRYSDPEAMKMAGEGFIVTSNAARGMRGKVVFSGAAWYRKDYRRRGLVEWLPRIARAYARSLWDTRNTITFMSEKNVAKGVFPRNGYSNLEWSVQLNNTDWGTMRMAFLWSKDDEMLDDLRAFLASHSSIASEALGRVGTK